MYTISYVCNGKPTRFNQKLVHPK